MVTCYRHPSRETGVSCSNCGRPICPDCMTTTPVGMRCPECSRQTTPVKTISNTVRRPEVTIALIVINVIAFLAEGNITLTGQPSDKVYEKGALIGSFPGLPEIGVAHGQWWRIVTGGFLHENLLHIGFNMYILWILGQMLEPALGRLRFGLIYAVSLLAGSLGALIVTPHSPTVGASGAVFGLMGAAAVEMRSRQIPIMQSGVGGLILINLIISFTLPGISWGGHIGGLIGGTLAALAIQFGNRYRSQALALGMCALLGAACFAGAIAVSKSTEVESGAPLRIGESAQRAPRTRPVSVISTSIASAEV
jgi:membrane associated rhomboid family serine protease